MIVDEISAIARETATSLTRYLSMSSPDAECETYRRSLSSLCVCFSSQIFLVKDNRFPLCRYPLETNLDSSAILAKDLQGRDIQQCRYECDSSSITSLQLVGLLLTSFLFVLENLPCVRVRRLQLGFYLWKTSTYFGFEMYCTRYLESYNQRKRYNLQL